ncbi:HAD domain-containing protein [uncultured Salinicola sp.]|uniref:HAD domain-containing protein n=1 Tax=uncultured Salinicola sp. TaxID=1193542 RepID=UPI0026264540|nr:HAD domain-containing protein [uncultured Salinicola sp.]|tara:strand:+ start:4272 stop:4730 length:459 start_codon:yes stop_codon:yes gene_type:complete
MIYLDIDGVLILPGDGNDDPDVRRRASYVADICRATGCMIVVSSQRRISDDVLHLLSDLGLQGFITRSCPDRTPFIRGDDLDPDLPVRGQEIDAHMAANHISRHVVIDDDFALPHHDRIAIDPDVGITADDADSAIDILMRSRPTVDNLNPS